MMKKLWMLPVLLLAAVACSDDNGGDDVPPPSADQHVTCEISAPADGAEVDMSAKMTIEGDAEINAGKISKVTLTVGGKVVSDVTSVPFTYDYEFAEDQAAGEFKIALAVEGDAGAKASDEVTVTLKAPEQHLTCTISWSRPRGRFSTSGRPITIKGDATADIGSVSAAVLKVGGKTIAEVTNVPFTYEYAVAADQAEGALKIELAVEGRQGRQRLVGGECNGQETCTSAR